MLRLSAFLLSALALPLAFAQLPKNGGLNDDRPVYENPEDAVYKAIEPKLKTQWTDPVASDPDNTWPEYPRPQLRRDTWANLNGVWQYQVADGPLGDDTAVPFNTTLNERILVPFCIESGLSGIARQSNYSWYRTTFDVPESFDQNITLHFAAVDYETTVWVNGQQVGSHTGGYDKFHFDITSAASKQGDNELIVYVFDPTDGGEHNIPIGKQRVVPSHIFYTPCSGIWQTVSIEAVPSSEYVTNIDLRAAADGTVNTTISTNLEGSSSEVTVSILDRSDNSNVVASGKGTIGSAFTFQVENPDLWTPETPNLYNISVTVGDDTAFSYTGFRTAERNEVDGVQRFVLNGKPVFQFGPLDQGYWPDGLHTPPSYEAMTFDIKYLKNLGMNFIRKHIKVEPDLYYWAADSLGMILMQDMPALNTVDPNEEDQTEWERQLDIMVRSHLSFPSILSFVIYNEGWGQLRSGPEIYLVPRVADLVSGHQLINAMSGWNDWHQQSENISLGDYHDNHHYSSPQCGTPFSSIASTPYDSRRIGFQGEFGGVGHNVSVEHAWNDWESIKHVNETYEIDLTVDVWNYRALRVIEELREQTEMFSCNGGVYTQTTDVEGEVNGFLTYDRAYDRTDQQAWKDKIAALFDTFAKVTGQKEDEQPEQCKFPWRDCWKQWIFPNH